MGPTWSILVDVGVNKYDTSPYHVAARWRHFISSAFDRYPQATHGILADADFMPMDAHINKMVMRVCRLVPLLTRDALV